MAVNGQRCLKPPVELTGLFIVVDHEIAAGVLVITRDLGGCVVVEIPVGDLLLSGDLRRDIPARRHFPEGLNAGTVRIERVVVVLDELLVGHRVAGQRIIVA